MVLFNAADSEQLNQWLVKNLDAISDAEPVALAKYILELLNMWTNDSEKDVRPKLVDELTDFLQREAAPFVDRLLATLRSKSYLPYDDPTKPPTPPYLKQSGKGKKRGREQDDADLSKEQELRGPPKGPRRDKDERPQRRDERKPPEGPRADYRDDGRTRNGRSRSRGRSEKDAGGRSDNGGRDPGVPRQPKEPCKDYWEHGYCNRGAACPYSHGNDPLTSGLPQFPNQSAPGPPNFPNQGPGFMPGPGGMPPMNPLMAMQMLSNFFPPGFQPPLGFMPPNMGQNMHMGYDQGYSQNGMQNNYGGGGAYESGIQDLTPHSFRGGRGGNGGGGRGRGGRNFPMNGNHAPVPSMGEDVMMGDLSQSGPSNEGQMNGHSSGTEFRGRGGRGDFRGRGGRPERPPANRNSGDPSALTIVVEKLPAEKTNMGELQTYFSKFGTVTNVAVDARGNRALVSFKEHDEAVAAWKSEEAVFGNRFVKVFWHRPVGAGGAIGKKALEASASTLAKINAQGNGEDVDMTEPAGPEATNGYHASEDTKMDVAPPKKPKTPQEIYEYASKVWMEKMKGIMDVMQSSTASETEKNEAKAKFKVLKSQKPQPPGTTSSAIKPGASSEGKDKVDLDLDALASGEQGEMTQEEAQAALARLQELAAERGLDPDNMEEDQDQPTYGYGRGRGYAPRRTWRGGYNSYGYRGRGRGRGAALAAMQSASLDLRTKKLVLKGYNGVDETIALDLVQSFYLPTGQAEEVEKAPGEEGGIVVGFETRLQAEQALRGGPPAIEGLPPLTVQWFNPPQIAQPKTSTVPNPVVPLNLDDESVMESTARGPAKRPVRGDDHDDEERW